MVAPSANLLRALAAWSAGAVLVVAWPGLAPLAWASLVALATVGAWDARLLLRAGRVVAARQLPQQAYVDQDLEIRITLINEGDLPASVEIIDEVAEDIRGEEPRLAAVVVGARGSTTVAYSGTPRRRGNRPFGSILVIRESPLGLWRRRWIEDAAAVLRVYPGAARLRREGLLDSAQAMARAGVKPSRKRGEGSDFESLRDYVEGDDPRRVHWGASARRGRPIVRVNQHESNHAVVIAVDTSRLMGVRVASHNKLDYAIDAALALSYSALAQGDGVGMASFDAAVHDLLLPRTSPRQFAAIVDRLQPLAYAPREANYRALVRVLCARQRRRALVVLLTDFAEIDPQTLVAPLLTLSGQHRVVVAAFRDPVFSGLDPSPGEAGATLPIYRRLVLDDLARAREAMLAQLRRHGILTIDAEPQGLSTRLVNRYLAIRYGPTPMI